MCMGRGQKKGKYISRGRRGRERAYGHSKVCAKKHFNTAAAIIVSNSASAFSVSKRCDFMRVCFLPFLFYCMILLLRCGPFFSFPPFLPLVSLPFSFLFLSFSCTCLSIFHLSSFTFLSFRFSIFSLPSQPPPLFSQNFIPSHILFSYFCHSSNFPCLSISSFFPPVFDFCLVLLFSLSSRILFLLLLLFLLLFLFLFHVFRYRGNGLYSLMIVSLQIARQIDR